MERVSATYYLEFNPTAKTFLQSVQEFFSWATMGTSRRYSYLPLRVQESLAGSVVNISRDPSNPFAGMVSYEFHEDTFEECDISLLLDVLLYSSIQGSTKQLRLLDLTLPASMWAALPGPRLGSDGLRSLMGSAGRPLFGVILKPRQGLTPELAASIAEAATKGGADYIIDDEVLVNPPSCRLVERVKKIVSVCEPVARRRERPLLYIANVTARPSRVMAWIDQLQELEQNEVRLGLMVNGLVMGFETVTDIRNAMPQWPLIATTVTCGMVVLSPQYNISEHILVQLSRLVGADAVYAVRHATEYAFDPSKIHTILSHLGRQEHLTKPSMPIYAGAINLGTILRDELPRSPEFMVQAGTTVCGYEQVGQSFPETITTATRILVDALTSIYCDGLTGHELAERLVHDNNRHAKRANLSRLGLSP